MTSIKTYDHKTIYYHWISAALILGLWFIGQNIDSFSKGDPRVIVRSIHITLGIILAVIFALRLKWKAQGGVKLPQATPGMLGKLAIGVHHLLYLLLGLTLVVGIAAVWIRGDNIFNLFHIPPFDPTDAQLREEVVDIHEFLANSLLVLAAGHALMAIWHHKIMKDGVLKRMLPKLK
jgi:cytochrome b561